MIVVPLARTIMYVRNASVGALGLTLEIALPVSPVDGGEDQRRSVSVLARIAAALNVPVRAFSDDPPTGTEVSDTIELLRLWHDLKHAAGRQKLLALAHSLAAERQ